MKTKKYNRWLVALGMSLSLVSLAEDTGGYTGSESLRSITEGFLKENAVFLAELFAEEQACTIIVYPEANWVSSDPLEDGSSQVFAVRQGPGGVVACLQAAADAAKECRRISNPLKWVKCGEEMIRAVARCRAVPTKDLIRDLWERCTP